MPSTLSLPGFVNAHTHTFQRALRGRAAGTDFWAWRDGMLEEAGRATADGVRAAYADAYREMLAAGYTAVGEFHYLGAAEGRAAAEAAASVGMELVLLHVAYARGGLERMRQPSVAAYLDEVEALRADGIRVGLAPHSVRACPRDWLEEIGRYADREGLVLHVHADEQPREIEECLAEHGCRPVELLARTGCLTERTTVVHGTHADGAELDLIAASGRHRVRVPDDRGRPRRRVPARGPDQASRHQAVHRLGLEHAHRPARGAAPDRGHRPQAERHARRLLDRGAARDGRRRGRESARPRVAGPTSPSTSGTARSRASPASTCRPRSWPAAAPT